jgi:photosystem II stability/assembly factor-like uncharacterized protein
MKWIIILLLFYSISYTAYSQWEPTLVGSPGATGNGGIEQFVIYDRFPGYFYFFAFDGFRIKKPGQKRLIPIKTIESVYYLSAAPDNPAEFFVNDYDYYQQTTDFGKTWRKLFKKRHDFAYSPARVLYNYQNPNTIYLIADSSRILKSYDRGETWNTIIQFSNDISDLVMAPSDSSVLYLVMNNFIYLSKDAGYNWEFVLESSKSINKLYIKPDNPSSFYFAQGNLYKAENWGQTIKILWGSEQMTHYAVDPNDSLTILGGQWWYLDMMKTTDEGNTWTSIDLPGPEHAVEQITFDKNMPGEVYALSVLGIFRSTDSGENWSFADTLSYISPWDVYIGSTPGELYHLQDGWLCTKSTDYGESWNLPDQVPFIHYWLSRPFQATFDPYDSLTGIMTADVRLLKTTNGGKTWDFFSHLEKIRSVSFHPKIRNLLLASRVDDPLGGSRFYRSTDRGETWDSLYMGPYYDGIQRIVFDPNNNNIVYGQGGVFGTDRIYKSVDTGKTWLHMNVDAYGVKDMAIRKDSSNIIYYVQPVVDYQPGRIRMSTDYGESWRTIGNSLSELESSRNIYNIWLDDRKPGRFYVGTQKYASEWGGLYLTEDNGETWRKLFDRRVLFIRADNEYPRNIYFGTVYGLMRFTDTLTVSSVEDEEITADNFYLYQNYPNPFNPSTTISYRINKRDKAELKIFDILGREIITLVDEIKEPGYHEVKFNAAYLSSGMYIYRLRSGIETKTRKLMLIK